MKKISRSSQPYPPVKPLVRGPRNNKQKGELAELTFLQKAASLGFGVAKPYGDGERYDFILDSGERFWRVQVRSTSSPRGRHGYIVPPTAARGAPPKPTNQKTSISSWPTSFP
jgi:hypothetical protein